jgi:hypothetical protein
LAVIDDEAAHGHGLSVAELAIGGITANRSLGRRDRAGRECTGTTLGQSGCSGSSGTIAVPPRGGS